MSVKLIIVLLLISFLQIACAAKPPCTLSEGFKCKSLSEAYALDESGISATPSDVSGHHHPGIALNATEPVSAEEGTPIFQQPRRIRIWLADWGTQDLYVPNHYIYWRVDAGRWLVPSFQWPSDGSESND